MKSGKTKKAKIAIKKAKIEVKAKPVAKVKAKIAAKTKAVSDKAVAKPLKKVKSAKTLKKEDPEKPLKVVASKSATGVGKTKCRVVSAKASGQEDTSKAPSAQKPAQGVAEWMDAVGRDIAALKSEFSKELRLEVGRAFDMCLAAVEHASNLMESRMASVLGEVANLVTGAKPKFAKGKLTSVESDDGHEHTDYVYAKGGLVTSKTYRDGKLKFEIVHNEYGVPVNGKMFDANGKVVREFKYGPDGQVK